MPVFGSGTLAGKRKKVGVCADGSKAKHGTIAADTDFHPFGTQIYVPGYGVGMVHDRGGAIQGMNRLYLYFRNHDDALEWGRQELTVVLLD
jgi:3D (Asp-Asp-Asp) domain-containing protein